MIEQFFDLETSDGTMPSFSVRPEGDGPYPVVIFQMDAPGMREEIRDMCRRLASAGYYVMTSQLYYRHVEAYNVFETGDRERMFELMSGLSNSMAAADAAALVSHAEADAAADTDHIGVTGYCMSGPFSIAVAHHIGDRVKAAVSVHGVALVTDRADSPHAMLDGLNAEVYIAAAETDSYAPPEMIDAFADAMSAAGNPGSVEWYPGTEHGFAYAERPAYDQDASERHWERTHELFDRQLRGR